MSWVDRICAAEPGTPRALVLLERAQGRGSKQSAREDIEDAITEVRVDGVSSLYDLLDRYGLAYSRIGLHEAAARFAAELRDGTLVKAATLTVRVTARGKRPQDHSVQGRKTIMTEVGEVLATERSWGYELLLPVGAYVELLEWVPGQPASEAKVLARFRSDPSRGLIEVRGKFVIVARFDDGTIIGVNWA